MDPNTKKLDNYYNKIRNLEAYDFKNEAPWVEQSRYTCYYNIHIIWFILNLNKPKNFIINTHTSNLLIGLFDKLRLQV